MDMDEWASRKLYEYPWFLHMDKEDSGEPKPVQLSLISGYGQGRMAEPKPYDYPWFLHMDKEEWLSPNPYD